MSGPEKHRMAELDGATELSWDSRVQTAPLETEGRQDPGLYYLQQPLFHRLFMWGSACPFTRAVLA